MIRRFVRKVQASGKLNLAKQNQYRQPKKSKRLRRRSAIKQAELRQEKEHLRKIGKLEERGSRSKTKS
ncbi:MAG: hypothetical protein Q8P90_00460 [bacterium]|nr:hypothetical protein [bacterium]